MAQVPPVAKPRTKLVKLSNTVPSTPPRDEVGSSPEWQELLTAIRRFTELESKPDSDVLPEQRDAATRYLTSKKPLYYKHIQLGDLVNHNKSKPDNIRTALDKLFKYATNLLSPNPPRAWRSIKFATAFYHHHVKPVKGAQEILMSMGYSKDTGRALEFEADKPDYNKVTEITAELLVAKFELERILERGMLAEQGPVQQREVPHPREIIDDLPSVTSDVDRYGMVSSERPPPPVAKPRKSTSSSSGSKPPTVRRVEERGPMIGHTPTDHVHDDRHPIVDNDDDVDDDVLRLRREREKLMQSLLGPSPSTEIGSENGIKDVEDEEEKFYDAQEEPLPQTSIRREPEGGSTNDHQHRSPHQSGSSKDHYGHTVPSGNEPPGYNDPQGAVGPPHHKGDIHRGAGGPPDTEDISEYVDISRKDYIMSPEYKEKKRKEYEEKQRRQEDERRQKELYDDGFFFMTWLRECVKYGYEPEDVEHAVNQYRNTSFRTPLEYLQHEWEDYKQVVQRTVARNGQVGQPSLIEARDCLLEVGGSAPEAIETCIAKRTKKIHEFMEQYPSATPEEAAKYLTRYKLNVEVAVSVLQTDKLKPVVAFIWDDVERGGPGEIRRKEEDRLCDHIKTHREKNVQYCCHLLMGEYKLESEDRASLVLELMKGGREFGQCITLAKNCRNMEEAERYSNQECPICCCTFMMDEMVTMLHCACSTCRECFKTHYTLVAKEQSIAHFNCLLCGVPDLGTSDINNEDYLTMFANLLKECLDYEHYQLFQKKATEFALSKEDTFRWCAHCGCGFIHEPPANRRIRCPHCGKDMCFHCKKPWEDQHKGLPCNDFARWKAENDEENQQKGLAAFLKENGIECPKCSARYDLAKGGCLHFNCAQCPTKFCGGCGAVFDKNCRKFQGCEGKGFHAHHPRDCLFYMRDWDVERLQKVLQDKEIEFDTEPPQNQVNAAQVKKEGDEVVEPPKDAVAVGSANQGLKCRVMLQKEMGSGKVDEECGDDCNKGHAGLCKKHYKEYLVCKINEAGIDPGEFMEVDEIRPVLMREDKQVPNKQANETDQAYLQRLKEYLKTEIVLEKRGMFNL